MLHAGAALISYEGRRFRPPGSRSADVTEALYHQDGDLVWAEIGGADVRRGALTGVRAPGGQLHFAYTLVRDDGSVVCGRCESRPEVLEDGRIVLHETWERFAPHAASGVSTIEEVR